MINLRTWKCITLPLNEVIWKYLPAPCFTCISWEVGYSPALINMRTCVAKRVNTRTFVVDIWSIKCCVVDIWSIFRFFVWWSIFDKTPLASLINVLSSVKIYINVFRIWGKSPIFFWVCLYFCDLICIFVILPVFLLFSHGQSVSEQLQLLIYPFLSSKCRELHLRLFFKQKREI